VCVCACVSLDQRVCIDFDWFLTAPYIWLPLWTPGTVEEIDGEFNVLDGDYHIVSAISTLSRRLCVCVFVCFARSARACIDFDWF
jgi:hypothetical protein